MSQAQLEDKYLDCAKQVIGEDVARKILAMLNTLPGRPSLDELWPLLRKG
jgi:hypothetical protein